MVSDDEIIKRLDSVQESIDGTRNDLRGRINRQTIALVVAAVIALLGLVVGAVGISQIHSADTSRKQRTVAACQQANQSTNDKRDDDKKTWHFVIDYAAAGQPEAARQTAKDAIDGQLDQNATDRQRDCSPRGLAAYYSPKNQR